MRIKLIVPAVLTAVALSGCATESGSKSEAKAGTNRPADAAVAEETAEEPTEEPTEEPADANLTFGQTFTYENGVSMTVSAPKPFKPSEYAYTGDSGATSFVVFDITVVNGSKENYDPALFHATMQSGNTEAEAVFDTEQGLESTPSTAVLPGRETAFKLGFAVADPADLVMQVSVGMFDYDDAIFTS